MYNYPNPRPNCNRPHIPNEAELAFQSPDIFWLADPAFDQAFRDLTGDTSMTEAAWTDPTEDSFPGYVNAQVGIAADQTKSIVLTVRGNPTGEPGVDVTCGITQQLAIPLDAWDQFIANATKLRAGA